MSKSFKRAVIAWTAFSVIFTSTASSYGVLIAGGTGAGNTTAPSGLPQWANVGTIGASSGIYLGNGWAITAGHVGAGTLTLPSGGGSFAYGGVQHTLKNPDNSNTDLVVFNLATTPALPTLSIPASAPVIGTNVYMIGNGRNRTSDLKYYNTSTNPWTTLPDATGAGAAGYDYSTTSGTLRWGINATSDANPGVAGIQTTADIFNGFATVRSIGMQFNPFVGEGAAVPNDSGGAVFNATGNLIGVLHAINAFVGQPDNTRVFGNSSFAADLSTYRSQIYSFTGIPEPTSLGVIALSGIVLMRRRVRG